MPKKHMVIALQIQPNIVDFDGTQIKVKLPYGCKGICLVFESKKTAKEYFGKTVPLVRIEEKPKIK